MLESVDLTAPWFRTVYDWVAGEAVICGTAYRREVRGADPGRGDILVRFEGITEATGPSGTTIHLYNILYVPTRLGIIPYTNVRVSQESHVVYIDDTEGFDIPERWYEWTYEIQTQTSIISVRSYPHTILRGIITVEGAKRMGIGEGPRQCSINGIRVHTQRNGKVIYTGDEVIAGELGVVRRNALLHHCMEDGASIKVSTARHLLDFEFPEEWTLAYHIMCRMKPPPSIMRDYPMWVGRRML